MKHITNTTDGKKIQLQPGAIKGPACSVAEKTFVVPSFSAVVVPRDRNLPPPGLVPQEDGRGPRPGPGQCQDEHGGGGVLALYESNCHKGDGQAAQAGE